MSEKTHQAVAVIEAPGVPETMHPVVKAMMARDLGPEDLEKILALQERYEANEARKAYAAALVALKRDMPTVIAKDATVDFPGKNGRTATHYTHASLAGAMRAVTEPLTKHGFALAWTPSNEKPGIVSITARLTHAAGHFEECTLSGPPDMSGNKNPLQAIGSAASYLERYTALALLGVVTADIEEPKHDEPPPEAVNTARNLKAAKAVADSGRKREDAEKLVGRKVQEWTSADLEKISEWAKPASSPHLAEALKALEKCESEGELKAVGGGIAKLGLKGDDLKQTKAAYTARLAEIEASNGKD